MRPGIVCRRPCRLRVTHAGSESAAIAKPGNRRTRPEWISAEFGAEPLPRPRQALGCQAALQSAGAAVYDKTGMLIMTRVERRVRRAGRPPGW